MQCSGTCDSDCFYHFALYVLIKAVEQTNAEDSIEMIKMLIDGNRLKDISDLPIDLAVRFLCRQKTGIISINVGGTGQLGDFLCIHMDSLVEMKKGTDPKGSPSSTEQWTKPVKRLQSSLSLSQPWPCEEG